MSFGGGIFVIALGAVLAFAVRTDLFWLDLQIAGVVLIATGIAMTVLVAWRRRQRRETVEQERVYHDGRPETVKEKRVYRDESTRGGVENRAERP